MTSLIQSILGLRIVFIALFKRRNGEINRFCEGTFWHINNNEDAVKLGLVMRRNLYNFLFCEFFFQKFFFYKFLF